MDFDVIYYETYTWMCSCCSCEAPCEQNNSDPKKCAKVKKPDENLVSLVFLG